ncbi:hypothetical protein L1049_021040 [Liquidambar formosana]|uniref:F-box domain-containing protein n=1 Tax=Liquidambar formosana TaxID=63359 RepID=A0AAP0SE06_LIQFO
MHETQPTAVRARNPLQMLCDKPAAAAVREGRPTALGGKRNNCLDDRISQLADEVLVSILSLWTIKEVASTSVLSHRWGRLWTSFTGSLNFDAAQTLFDIRHDRMLLEKESSRYISWVNQVLDSLGWSNLDDFRVHKEFTQFVELTKLKLLILRVDAYDDASLLGWTNLIKASPFLHRFTLEVSVFYHLK